MVEQRKLDCQHVTYELAFIINTNTLRLRVVLHAPRYPSSDVIVLLNMRESVPPEWQARRGTVY